MSSHNVPETHTLLHFEEEKARDALFPLVATKTKSAKDRLTPDSSQKSLCFPAVYRFI